jgi:hypothetical protein
MKGDDGMRSDSEEDYSAHEAQRGQVFDTLDCTTFRALRLPLGDSSQPHASFNNARSECPMAN